VRLHLSCSDGQYCNLSAASLKCRTTCHVTNPFFVGFQEDDCPAQLWKEAEILVGVGCHSLSVASHPVCPPGTGSTSVTNNGTVTVAETLVTQVNTEWGSGSVNTGLVLVFDHLSIVTASDSRIIVLGFCLWLLLLF